MLSFKCFFTGCKDKRGKLFNLLFPLKNSAKLPYLLRQRKGSMCSNWKLKEEFHLLAKPPVSRCMHIMILKNDNGTLENYPSMK